MGFVRALLDRIEADHATDRKRVYVSGASNGGLMTYRLLIEMPERFAAAAAFIAHLPRDTDRLHAPARAVPLLLWSGTLDPLMQYQGGEILGRRGDVRSADETVAWWVEANRADRRKARTEKLPDTAPDDGCRIERTAGVPPRRRRRPYGTPKKPAPRTGPIRQRLIGSTCSDVEGAELAWAFMRDFSLPK